jgi:hypothetical protein
MTQKKETIPKNQTKPNIPLVHRLSLWTEITKQSHFEQTIPNRSNQNPGFLAKNKETEDKSRNMKLQNEPKIRTSYPRFIIKKAKQTQFSSVQSMARNAKQTQISSFSIENQRLLEKQSQKVDESRCVSEHFVWCFTKRTQNGTSQP